MFKDERKRAPRIRIDAPLDSRLVSGVSHKASTGNKSKLLSRLGHSSVTRGGRAKLLNAVSRNDQSQNMSESYHNCQKEQQGHNEEQWTQTLCKYVLKFSSFNALFLRGSQRHASDGWLSVRFWLHQATLPTLLCLIDPKLAAFMTSIPWINTWKTMVSFAFLDNHLAEKPGCPLRPSNKRHSTTIQDAPRLDTRHHHLRWKFPWCDHVLKSLERSLPQCWCGWDFSDLLVDLGYLWMVPRNSQTQGFSAHAANLEIDLGQQTHKTPLVTWMIHWKTTKMIPKGHEIYDANDSKHPYTSLTILFDKRKSNNTRKHCSPLTRSPLKHSISTQPWQGRGGT